MTHFPAVIPSCTVVCHVEDSGRSGLHCLGLKSLSNPPEVLLLDVQLKLIVKTGKKFIAKLNALKSWTNLPWGKQKTLLTTCDKLKCKFSP